MPKQFEVGGVYKCRSICDAECEWIFTVASRTAKMVTLIDDRFNEIKRRVSEWDGAEVVMPVGSYSMAPILRAA